MKALMFQPQFVGPISVGAKKATMRLHEKPRYKVGEPIRCVRNLWHITKTTFAEGTITSVEQSTWATVPDSWFEETTVTRQWYIDRYGDRLTDDTPVCIYRFEVSK